MSQFFKALEQAERDRLRQDDAEEANAPAGPKTAARHDEVFVTDAPAGDTVVTERPPTDPKVSQEASSTRVASEPVISKPPESRRPVTKTAPRPSPGPSTSTTSVFRASLRKPDDRRRVSRVNGRQPLLIAQSDPASLEADAYRTLRANIELMSTERGCRYLSVTSAVGGDGKSTTAANLAVVAAQGGRRVCLVDADLRRPTLHDVFGLPNVDGLALALREGKSLQAVARPADIENLSIVVAGRGAKEEPQDLLTPQRLEKMRRESEGAFDFVLFDTPPVISVSDALNVAATCDGVILVVRAGSVPFSVLRRAVAQIRQVKGRVLGVLLNQVNLRGADADFYRHYRTYHAGSKA